MALVLFALLIRRRVAATRSRQVGWQSPAKSSTLLRLDLLHGEDVRPIFDSSTSQLLMVEGLTVADFV